MGGNGAYDHFRNYSLDIYTGDRFKQVGTIRNNKIVSSSVKGNKSIPVNSFKSKMYYVTSPDNPDKIVAIAFYSGRTHKIIKSIDLVFDKSGNYVPYKTVVRKGKKHTIGTHAHKWPGNTDKGNVGRKSHGKNNTFSPTKSDMRYIKKALEYNKQHQKSNKQ